MVRLRRALLCSMALAASACAVWQTEFRRLPPPGPSGLERYKALNSLYVLLDLSDVRGPGGDLLAAQAEEFGEALADLDAGVAAYRVSDGAAPDPFLDAVNPAGILRVSFRTPVAAHSVSSETCTHQVTLRWDLSLRSHPAGEVLASFSDSHTGSVSHKVEGEAKEKGGLLKTIIKAALTEVDESEYDRLDGSMAAGAARRVAGSVAGAPRRLMRPLFKKSGDEKSMNAFDAAGAGRWGKAERLWKERLDSGKGDWRDWQGLAVASERRRDWARAREFYLKARDAAGRHRRIPFDAILADLDQAEALEQQAPRPAPGWFARKAAVLPFSDETTSVDGPEFLRALAAKRLKDGGWSTLPLEEVDARLRDHGISQGGQLRAVQPADIASWLGTDLLLFGHITEFKEIPLGAYHKRAVKGRLTLWDAGKGAEAWTRETSVVEQSAGGKDIGARLASQLVGGLFERIAKSPLGEESRRFVGASLASLPMRPSR